MQHFDTFLYEYLNLWLYSFHEEWMIVLATLAWSVISLGMIFYLLRFFYLYSKAREERMLFNKKKRLLDDLILMKDIQTELEKEIEQAILKAAFQS